MNIFLADDDEDDRIFFSDALKEIPLDSQVKTFSNGVELMAELHSEIPLPEVIFLDLNMPMMDGFECLEDIRAVDKFKTIPVIIYSISLHKKDVARLEEMGATRYLKKPSSYNQLKTMLYKCLSPIRDQNFNEAQSFLIDE
ncbi:response regulator receiver domain-containing protein [Flavobacteriaceae bacterium MAR_2009_75]|nr:response regulator receiver domain-containing protein [Flavobacteriaceae bacterium MAR_2009_75]